MRRIVERMSGRCIGSDEKMKEVSESVDLYSVIAIASQQSTAATWDLNFQMQSNSKNTIQ